MDYVAAALIIGALLGILVFGYYWELEKARKVVRQRYADEQRCYDVRLDNYNEAVKRVAADLSCDFALEEEERLLYRDQATITWDAGTRDVPNPFSKTQSKTSGGAVGAVVGGIALGPVGAVAGYALSQKTTVTTAARTFKVTDMGSDPGMLSVTTKRLVFIGERGTTLVAPLSDVLQVSAQETRLADRALPQPYFHGRTLGQNEVRFRRADALPNERFIVRNLAYFMLAMHNGGRHEIGPPTKPALSS